VATTVPVGVALDEVVPATAIEKLTGTPKIPGLASTVTLAAAPVVVDWACRGYQEAKTSRTARTTNLKADLCTRIS
jgi:hypothetical protein